MLLTLHNVARLYGSRLIFKDISLEISRGTVTLLAGSNGAGKSTLLQIMAGLIRPSAGNVTYGMRAAPSVKTAPKTSSNTSPKNHATPLIGFLGHQTFIYPDLSALENLAFWSSLYGCAHKEAALLHALERVELAPFALEKAGAFSRGMAQRLNLARVFLLQPDLLLLDEPGTGLDVRSMDILYREIQEAKNSGKGIVWITHSITTDLQRADNIAVIDKRRLAFYGTVAEYTKTAQQPDMTEATSSEQPQATGAVSC